MDWGRMALATPFLIGLWFMYRLLKTRLDISMAKLMRGSDDGSAEATLRKTMAMPGGEVLENLEYSCSGKTLQESIEGIEKLIAINKKNGSNNIYKS